MHPLVRQRLTSIGKATVATIAATGAIKTLAESRRNASRIPDSALKEAAKMLKTEPQDSFGRKPDNADLKTSPFPPPKTTRR